MKIRRDAAGKNGKNEDIVTSIDDTKTKVSSFIETLEDHLRNDEYDAEKDSLDFLEVKNSLMLSYLIDLAQLLRLLSQEDPISATAQKQSESSCLNRLHEMKVVFEKIAPLEKKLQYQMDRLLSQNDASSFAASEDVQNDPSSSRPNPENMLADDEEGSDDDRDPRTASGHSPEKRLYQPPRLTTAEFPEPPRDSNDRDLVSKKHRNRMLQSEFLQTLQETVTDRPEEDDALGGAAVGKQRETSRRFLERQKEKLKFEEENMVRLPSKRKEKKDFQRMLQQERGGDIAGISDLGKLAGDIERMSGGGDRDGRSQNLQDVRGAGKRRDGGKKHKIASNSYQKTLFGVDGGRKKKHKKKG